MKLKIPIFPLKLYITMKTPN